jgi:hypothetical protein
MKPRFLLVLLSSLVLGGCASMSDLADRWFGPKTFSILLVPDGNVGEINRGRDLQLDVFPAYSQDMWDRVSSLDSQNWFHPDHGLEREKYPDQYFELLLSEGKLTLESEPQPLDSSSINQVGGTFRADVLTFPVRQDGVLLVGVSVLANFRDNAEEPEKSFFHIEESGFRNAADYKYRLSIHKDEIKR